MIHLNRAGGRLALILTLLISASCAGASIVTVRHGDDGGTSTGRHVNGMRNGPWTEYYADGRKQCEGSYENDVQVGPWKYWFENGTEEMEGSFVGERRDGEWRSWHENGALRAVGRFERGFEEGRWKFYADSGALEREGLFELGRPVLRWTFFHPDGTVRATGNFRDGVKVGAWTTVDEKGNKEHVTYPMPKGCELVEEFFGDGSPKRSGFLCDGVPCGRWISGHEGGALRLECGFERGSPNGRARAWRPDGSLLAVGSLSDGSVVGEWQFRRGLAAETITFELARPRSTFSGEWSPASSAEQPGPAAVESWVAEMCSAREAAPLDSASAPTIEGSPSTVVPDELSALPARAQRWTEYESRVLPELVKMYGSGKARRSPDSDDWGASTLPIRKAKLDVVVATPAELVGRPLPLSRFTTADGGEIDLGDYVGKRNVLVTILRGFGGQVCVYCAAQTKGLADHAAAFAALDTEVVVVFPGPASGLTAFREAYRRTFGAGEKLPYKMLYDTGLTLTRALHIEDNIAVPTSILLDRQGIVRWCHVAKDYSDRPSAQQVLDQIAALAKR